MATFLGVLSEALHAPAVTLGLDRSIESDPEYTHWVLESTRIIGEAKEVEPVSAEQCFAHVRLFDTPDIAEHGKIDVANLRNKGDGLFA
jgi:hypothetical protein